MEQTLLLNASYEPLKVVHWQKAITLLCQGKVEVISVYDREVRAVSFSFKLPSVIRLLRYIRFKRRFDYVPFSRANIYARDQYACQYCGETFATSDLTFDHVMPVAQGGLEVLPASNGVLNAASFAGGPVAPGEIVTIFGSGRGTVLLIAGRQTG